jgi:methyl-accepting chemotaxis protein
MLMQTLSSKIAYPIIIAGFFVIVSYVALNFQNLTGSFYVISGFLAIYVFLFGFAIGQNFTKPVKKLLERANELSQGDLKSRFYLESKDELGQLARVFNRIADQLEESSAKNEKIEKSVGLKVEAETQSLREVIDALEKKVQNRTMEYEKMAKDLERFKQVAAEQKKTAPVQSNSKAPQSEKDTKDIYDTL